MRKIKHATLISPLLSLAHEIKILYLPNVDRNPSNHSDNPLKLHFGGKESSYRVFAIFYELPLTFYAILNLQDYKGNYDNSYFDSKFKSIIIKGEFEDDFPIKCDSYQFVNLEFPQMPTRYNYIIYQPNNYETKYFQCNKVEFRDSLQSPFLEVEEESNVNNTLEFIGQKYGIHLSYEKV